MQTPAEQRAERETADPDKAKAIKALRPYNPVGVAMNLAEIVLLVYVAHESHGIVFVGAVFFAALMCVGLAFGPKLRRKQYRKYMIADRAVTRIKAMRDLPINADDVFEVSPSTDRASFFLGNSHAMLRVEEQIRRAAADVDEL